MDQNEYQYKKVIGSIGVALLFFLLFLFVFQTVLSIAALVLPLVIANARWCDSIYQLLYAAGYLSSFMVPVAIIKRQIKRNKLVYQPMKTTLRFSKLAFLAIPLGISVIFSAAYINAAWVEVFYVPDVMDMLAPTVSSYEAYEIILQFIVVCLVPGFCEEFLFRGAILTNCLPFGRSTAILISSLLFSLMHQNPQQFFYAFAAGIFLGVLYEKSGSIWPGVFLHTLNNFVSSVQGILPTDFSDVFQGALVTAVLELFILFGGMIALAVLLPRFFGKKRNYGEGVFGKTVAASDAYASVPLTAAQQRKLFRTPSMMAFIIICCVEALMVLGVVILYGLLV